MILWPSFWAVLLATSLAYWRVPTRWRMWLLAGVSWGYLLTVEPTSILALTVWSLAFFYLAPLATKAPSAKAPAAGEGGWRRYIVRVLCLGIIGQLVLWKYVPPLLAALGMGEHKVAIPLGISYFTFKLLHYGIEAGRKAIKDPSPGAFMAYIFLFPIFTAGPIERYDHFLRSRMSTIGRQDVAEGLTRIVHGLIKKFVFVEMILLVLLRPFAWERVAEGLDRMRVPTAWYLLAIWFLYGYMDFSAYSDIAIGASRLLGIKVAENFNWPILATNIGDYWKRWHMSLAAFCQAYIYLPTMGLTRKPTLAVYSTFIVMGLWHAGSLNWIAWGSWHATAIVVYLRFLRRTRGIALFDQWWIRPAGWAITMIWVLLGQAMTGPHSLHDSVRLIAKLFGLHVA